MNPLDKNYQHLYDLTQDEQLLVRSGWLNQDDSQVDFDLHNREATPLKAIEANKGDSDSISIVIYPGCFAPVHEGHLEGMRIAKDTIEEQTGENVAAGYFIPDHDFYVFRKTQDIRFLAPDRIKILQEATQDSSWMEVDTWNSTFAPTALNFTTVYNRMEAYLQAQYPDLNVKIYLVFGEDNVMFANAFIKHGYAVCLMRENTRPVDAILMPDAEQRILFSTVAPPALSSTQVRARLLAGV